MEKFEKELENKSLEIKKMDAINTENVNLKIIEIENDYLSELKNIRERLVSLERIRTDDKKGNRKYFYIGTIIGLLSVMIGITAIVTTQIPSVP